jgi:hypothetical protein
MESSTSFFTIFSGVYKLRLNQLEASESDITCNVNLFASCSKDLSKISLQFLSFFSLFLNEEEIESKNEKSRKRVLVVKRKVRKKPKLIIDGSNVAMSTKSSKGSIDYLIQALNWGKKSGYKPLIIIDKSLFSYIDNKEKLKELVKKGIVKVAEGTEADLLILKQAEEERAFILTNDRFKEYQEKFSWLQSGERLIRFSFKGEKLKIFENYFVSS